MKNQEGSVSLTREFFVWSLDPVCLGRETAKRDWMEVSVGKCHKWIGSFLVVGLMTCLYTLDEE